MTRRFDTAKALRQLAKLRNMTVARGCPPGEAANARAAADVLEKWLERATKRGRRGEAHASRTAIDAITRWRPGQPLPDLGDVLAVLNDDSIVDAPEKTSHKLSSRDLELKEPAWRGNHTYYRKVRCSDCERRPPVWGCSDEEWRCTSCAKKAGYPTTVRACQSCDAEERVRHGYSNLSPYGGFCTDCLNRGHGR